MSLLDMLWGLLAAYGLVELMTRGAIIRFVWRELTRLFILAELAAGWVVRQAMPPKYVLLGQCHRRGACCKQILGDPPKLIKRTFLLRLWLAYHQMAHNFEAVGRGPNDEVIFSCNHLREDGRCGIYRYRPMLCRNYPVLGYFEAPRLLPGCGFSVAPRVVTEMQKRNSLPIVNPVVSVHHPSPDTDGADPLPEHYELVDTSVPSEGRTERGDVECTD